VQELIPTPPELRGRCAGYGRAIADSTSLELGRRRSSSRRRPIDMSSFLTKNPFFEAHCRKYEIN